MNTTLYKVILTFETVRFVLNLQLLEMLAMIYFVKYSIEFVFLSFYFILQVDFWIFRQFWACTLLRFQRKTVLCWISFCARCTSWTGQSGGKQPLSLGKGCCRKGVVIHELLHSLGMMHEHCRADRDQFIRINFNNIKPSKCNRL